MDTINVRVRHIDKLSKLQDAAALRAGATTPVRTATINQLHQDLMAEQVYLVRSETDQVLVTTDEHLQEIREGTDVFLIAFETESLTLDDVVALLKENLEIMRPYKAATTPMKTCLKRSVDNLERDQLKKSK